MQKDITPGDKFSTLRRRAEEIIDTDPQDEIKKQSPESARKLIHELNVHQIELEMQNDELRRTQLELEAARDKYSDLYDFAPVGYFTISFKGIILEVNLTGASMLGVDRQVLIRKPLSQFITKDSQDVWYFSYNRLVKGKKPQSLELKFLKKDGAVFHAKLECTIYQEPEGNSSQILIVISDISERKQTEEMLHQYEHIVSSSTDMMALLNKRYRYIAANKAYMESFRLTPEHVIGNTVANVFGEKLFNTVIKPKVDLCLGGEKINYQQWFDFPAYGRRFMDINYYPYYNQDKKIVGFAVNGRNITEHHMAQEALKNSHNELELRVRERTSELLESNKNLRKEIASRKQAEQQLIESKTMLQAVFDGISDPLVLLSKDMRIKMLNKAATKYYGLSGHQEVVGEFCHKALQDKSNPCEGCGIPLTVLNLKDMKYERQGLMDTSRVEQVSLFPLKRESEYPGDIIIRINDITERKLFEKQVIQSEKLASLGTLVSSIAHEINNPNSFISFNMPILKEYVEEMTGVINKYAEENPDLELFQMPYSEFRKDIFQLLDNVAHGSDRINSFVSNLRDFSRIQYGKKAKWVDLNSVIDKVISICGGSVKKAVRSFSVDVMKDFPPVFCDPSALEQILINLLLNAAHAAEKEDSWIRLSAKSGSTWLDRTIIEVKDNGCGIEKKQIKFIFDPFFSTKQAVGGTGLGLYVCHTLVEGMKGRIEVETEPGEYCTFRVILPDVDRRSVSRQ